MICAIPGKACWHRKRSIYRPSCCHHPFQALTAERQGQDKPPFLFATSLNCLSFNRSYILHTSTLALG